VKKNLKERTQQERDAGNTRESRQKKRKKIIGKVRKKEREYERERKNAMILERFVKNRLNRVKREKEKRYICI